MAGIAHVDYLRTPAPRQSEWLSRLWPVIGRVGASACYIGIVLFVFQSLQDRSETITVALIGLVFASLRAATLGGVCAQRRVAFLLENEIRSARQTIAEGIPAPPLSDAEFDRALETVVRPVRAEYVGLAAVASICLYQLALAVLYGMAYQQILELR